MSETKGYAHSAGHRDGESAELWAVQRFATTAGRAFCRTFAWNFGSAGFTQLKHVCSVESRLVSDENRDDRKVSTTNHFLNFNDR